MGQSENHQIIILSYYRLQPVIRSHLGLAPQQRATLHPPTCGSQSSMDKHDSSDHQRL